MNQESNKIHRIAASHDLPECSGNDPFLEDLVHLALEQSPWLSLSPNHFQIDWQKFFASHDENEDAEQKHIHFVLTQLSTLGGKYSLAMYQPGKFHAQLQDVDASYTAHSLKKKTWALPSAMMAWLETFRELGQRLLFEWDEAHERKAPHARSQHLRNQVVPQLREDIKATWAVEYAAMATVAYPFAMRLSCGKALPSELTELSFLGHRRAPNLEPMVRGLASAQNSLEKVWNYLDSMRREWLSQSETKSRLVCDFGHGVFDLLYEKNRQLASEAYQGSKYARDVSDHPHRVEGFSHLTQAFALLDGGGAIVKKTLYRFDVYADKALGKMCQSLKDFCTYFYPHTGDLGLHGRKHHDQALWLEHTIPRIKSQDPLDDTITEALSLPEGALAALDSRIESLLAATPLLLLLNAGFLSTYKTADDNAYGFALGPYAMAAALSKTISKKSPFHFLAF
jgi:hypothetical protein